MTRQAIAGSTHKLQMCSWRGHLQSRAADRTTAAHCRPAAQKMARTASSSRSACICDRGSCSRDQMYLQLCKHTLILGCLRSALFTCVTLCCVVACARSACCCQSFLGHMSGCYTGASSSLNLACIFQHLQRDFVPLITALPEFLEPYQSVNADGATLRRYAIVNSDNQVQFDAHATVANTSSPASQLAALSHKQSPLAKTSSAQAASARPATESKASSRQPAVASAGSNSTHAGIASAVTYMQRRYGGGLNILSPHCASQTPHADSAASTAGQACTFALTLQPTDPAWDTKEFRQLDLQGQLTADYPTQGSYTLNLDPRQSHISESAAGIVNQLIAAEGRAHAGRPGALQQLLRFVDNRAGMLFHEAEDIVLEAQRRRQAHSLSQSSGEQHQAAVRERAQAPPPPTHTSTKHDTSHARSSGSQVDNAADMHNTSAASAAARSARLQATQAEEAADHAADPAAEFAADLGSMHMRAEPEREGGKAAAASGHETDASSPDSQWDSSTSYAAHEQQTSESDYQHDSSDAEHDSCPGQIGCRCTITEHCQVHAPQ